jgi:MFS family permease
MSVVGERGVAPTVLGTGGRRPLIALLLADLVSTLGSEMAAVALPWFVLTTTGSPARTGLVVGAEFAGVALFGIPSGRLAARLGPRSALLLTDGLCVPAALLVPVLHWSGALTFPALIAAGLAIGATFPAHQSSQRLVLAAAVGDAEVALTRAGGMLGAANETASFVGPAVGGVLVAFIGAPWVLVVDAASFAVSFVLVAVAVPASGSRPQLGVQRTLDGVRYLVRTPVLRRRVAGLTVAGTGYTALLVCFPVLARERYGAGAALAGWLLASYGLGSVLGGLVAVRTRAVTDRGFALALAALAVTTWPLLLPSLPAWAVAACVGGYGVASGVVYPRLFAALTARPPERLRAQVLTAATTVLAVSGPVGGVAAGLLLAGGRPPSSALVLVVVVVSAGALLAAPSGNAGLDRWPKRRRRR